MHHYLLPYKPLWYRKHDTLLITNKHVSIVAHCRQKLLHEHLLATTLNNKCAYEGAYCVQATQCGNNNNNKKKSVQRVYVFNCVCMCVCVRAFLSWHEWACTCGCSVTVAASSLTELITRFSLALGYRSEHGALASHYLTGIDLIENYKERVCVGAC